MNEEKIIKLLDEKIPKWLSVYIIAFIISVIFPLPFSILFSDYATRFILTFFSAPIISFFVGYKFTNNFFRSLLVSIITTILILICYFVYGMWITGFGLI